MLSKLSTKLIVWYRILKNYAAYKSRAGTNLLEGERKSVFFHLSDIRQEPYYFPIIFSFHEQGYNIFLKDQVKFIGHSFSSGRFVFDLSRVFIVQKPPTTCLLLVTDSKVVFEKSDQFKKKVFLRSDVREFDGKKNRFLPYPMHPNSYHLRFIDSLNEERKKGRKVRILFSGNTDPVAYTNNVIWQRYKKINRVEVIDCILKELPPTNVIRITGDSDKDQLTNEYFNGIVLYLWQWSPVASKGLEIRIPGNEWLSFLASGDFFLCCPGIVIPQSHNAIEAMSVGTIPILQYSEYFHPKLEHGVNCILFDSKQDLISKINGLFRMTEFDIARMRQAVIDYYDEYLSHKRICQIVETLPEGASELFFYNESH